MHLIRSYALASLLLASMTAPLYGVELYDDRKVVRIEVVVQGESGADSKPVLARLKTKEGDDFSQLTFDDDLKRLSAEYDSVEPSIEMRGGKLYITLLVIPKPYIHQIRWEGHKDYSKSTLQQELAVEPNTVFNRAEFNKSFNKVKEFYFKKGYFESQLNYYVEPISGSNQVDLVIEVNEGRPGHIQEIRFHGFSAGEKAVITEQMYLKRYNFLLSWLTGTGIYRDEMLEQDRMTITNYLHNEGYADAKVTVQLSDDPLSHRLIIDITADKGPLYKVGSVTYSGHSLFSPEEIQKKSPMKTGDKFAPEKLRDSAQAVRDLYGQKGYIDSSVQFETTLKENEPCFDIHFTIDEGTKYKVGLVHIFGNTATRANVILRESLLVPGETFDARKLKATQSKLEAIGYFKSVNVYAVKSPYDDSLGDTYRDVYIEVEETTTGSISLFMGFSSADSVFGGIDLTERNFDLRGLPKALTGRLSSLRGGGEFFHIRATAGEKQNSGLISWMNPYVNDSLWRLGVELSRTFSKLQNDITTTTYGGSTYANYPLSTYWTVGMRQRIRHSKDNLELQPLGSSQVAQESVNSMKEQLNQDGLISAFSGNLSYDSTNNAFKPSRGWRSYFESEVAGLWGNYSFFKLSYINTLYFPVWRKGTIKFRGDFKYILPFGWTDKDHIPYSERFFLGGEVSGRGFKPYMLGPVVQLANDEGQLQETSTPYGGISSTFGSIEYNQEIVRMLDLFAFCDVGSVTFGEFDLEHFHPSAGIGARLDLGNRLPMMIGYGWPLLEKDRNNHNIVQNFFFSMGGQF